MKSFIETIDYFRLVLFLLLIISNHYCFAQGDPWSDESSIFEEENLYIDAYSNTNKRPIFEDQPAYVSGYLGIGVLKTPEKSDPRQMMSGPGLPCTPTSPSYPTCSPVPVNSEIIYLIVAGLIYGIYKTRKKYLSLNMVN